MQPTAMYTKDQDRCIAMNSSRGTNRYGIRVDAQGIRVQTQVKSAHVSVQVEAQVESHVSIQVEAHVSVQVEAQVDSHAAQVDSIQVESAYKSRHIQVEAHVSIQVEAHVSIQVEAHVSIQVEVQVEKSVEAQLHSHKSNELSIRHGTNRFVGIGVEAQYKSRHKSTGIQLEAVCIQKSIDIQLEEVFIQVEAQINRHTTRCTSRGRSRSVNSRRFLVIDGVYNCQSGHMVTWQSHDVVLVM